MLTSSGLMLYSFIEVCSSIDSSKTVGNSREVSHLQPIISQTQLVHLQPTAGSSRAVLLREA